MTDEARQQEINDWTEEHFVCPECNAVDTMYQEYASTFTINPITSETHDGDDGRPIEYYWCEECDYDSDEMFRVVEEIKGSYGHDTINANE